LFPDFSDRDLLYNYDKKMEVYNIVGSWTLEYNDLDKLFIGIGYKYMTPYPLPYKKDERRLYNVIRNINTYQKYDIFNEFIFVKNNFTSKIRTIYNFGIKYHYTNDLIISIKGENVFDNAQEQTYLRFNKDTLEYKGSVDISPIDRQFLLTVEYLF